VAFKQKMVQRLTGKNAISALQFARETGVRQQNLSRWLATARSLPLVAIDKPIVREWTVEQKAQALATNIKVYFCDPQHSWQRGSNENTNGGLRQYFPKGMDLSNVHQSRLNAVAKRLNERPRETLQFYSPAEKFSECVASIG
jgi:hypothetical protein